MSYWKCPICGYDNDYDSKDCLVCDTPRKISRPAPRPDPRPSAKAPPIDLISSDDEDVVKLVKHTLAPNKCVDLTNVPNDIDIVDLTGLPEEVEQLLIDPTTDERNICVYFNPVTTSSTGSRTEEELLLLRYNTPEFLMHIITESKDYIKELLFSEVQYLPGRFWGNFITRRDQKERLTSQDLALIRLGEFKMEYNGAEELKFSVIPEINIPQK